MSRLSGEQEGMKRHQIMWVEFSTPIPHRVGRVGHSSIETRYTQHFLQNFCSQCVKESETEAVSLTYRSTPVILTSLISMLRIYRTSCLISLETNTQR